MKLTDQQGLNLEQEVYHSLIEESPMPMALYVGKEMRIRIANKAMQDAWGKDASAIGKTLREALPELESQPFSKLLDDVFTTGIPYIAKEDRVDLVVDGRLQVFYFDFTYKPLLDASGKVWGILNTATDLTELVLAKKRLEESEQRFRTLIVQTPAALCVLNGPDFTVTIVNEKMLDIWGKTREQVINKPLFEGLPEAAEQGLEKLLNDVFTTGQAFRANGYRVTLFRNGRLEDVFVNFVYEAYRDGDGQVLGVIAIAIEVTEQVLATKRLEQSEMELLVIKNRLELELEAGKQLQQQKDDFIGIASHELKTPLTALKSSMQFLNRLLKENSGSAVIPSLIDLSNSNISKLTHLLEELLNDTRISEGQLQINKSRFILSDLINECCAHVRAAGKYRILVSGDLQLEVFADRHRLEQVIVNLVNNAIKYASLSPEIKIEIEETGQQARISVKDQGPGVAPEKLPHLFKRYYRVDTSGIQYSGLGLGLFISSEIIQRHQGEMGVSSILGEGSTFWFTIPLN